IAPWEEGRSMLRPYSVPTVTGGVFMKQTSSRLATALAVVGAWWRRCRGWLAGVEPGAPTLERPWRRTWDHLPKRSAGADFNRADYAAARARAREVARTTLGDALWAQLQRQGYLDVPSTLQPGLTY